MNPPAEITHETWRMTSLEERLKLRARALGFDRVGIAPARPADGFDRLQDWLARGYAGEMDYMRRHGDARRHPDAILPNVRSVVMVALNYHDGRAAEVQRGVRSAERSVQSAARGLVARYARGPDYHEVLRQRLKELLDWVRGESPGCHGRAVVDTAPLLERDFARRAGLGWFGKNTMLIDKKLGSYFFLGALLVDVELAADEPFATSHCGTCTACLDACPTGAFVEAGVLDSRRCISYLTIELRGPIDPELRLAIGGWLFGCDVCQEVCPWNRKTPAANGWPRRGDLESLDPVEVLNLSEAEFRSHFRDTALWRTRRQGLRRNAAIVLANQSDPRALPALERAAHDTDPVVREAASWAMARVLEHK